MIPAPDNSPSLRSHLENSGVDAAEICFLLTQYLKALPANTEADFQEFTYREIIGNFIQLIEESEHNDSGENSTS